MTETTLRACGGCHRHIKDDEGACPFCGSTLAPPAEAPRPSAPARVALAAALAIASGVGLAACYGGPPHPQSYRPPPRNQERPAQPAPSTGEAQQPLEPAPATPAAPR